MNSFISNVQVSTTVLITAVIVKDAVIILLISKTGKNIIHFKYI